MKGKRPTTRAEVRDMVFETIEKELVVPQAEISEDKTFSVSFKVGSGSDEGGNCNELGAESLDVFDLVLAFEDSFDIQIPNEDVDGLKTVGAVIDYICRQLGIKDDPPASALVA